MPLEISILETGEIMENNALWGGIAAASNPVEYETIRNRSESSRSVSVGRKEEGLGDETNCEVMGLLCRSQEIMKFKQKLNGKSLCNDQSCVNL